jgi:general secretion pathway protein G
VVRLLPPSVFLNTTCRSADYPFEGPRPAPLWERLSAVPDGRLESGIRAANEDTIYPTGEQPMRQDRILGFTLIEVMLVVILLAILAMIVIPNLGQASTDTKISSLRTNLQTIRTQIQNYRMQHMDYPDATFEAQMTRFTDKAGDAMAARDETHTVGPYLLSIPINPVSQSCAIRIVSKQGTVFAPPSTEGGWWYNSTTGEFRADLTDSCLVPDGTKYNDF